MADKEIIPPAAKSSLKTKTIIMTQKESLLQFKRDIETRKCVTIDLVWSDGRKAGIGNPQAIQAVIDTLVAELDRQIAECN